MKPVEPSTFEPLRFYVPSRTIPEHFQLVDLEEFNGNGFCSCEHFQYRLMPHLSRGSRRDEVFRCWHIRQARLYLADLVTDQFIAQRTLAREANPQPHREWKGIPSMSESYKEKMREYGPKRKAFLLRHPQCAVFPDERATDIHHTRGRIGSLLCDERYWAAVSRDGHQWIHKNIAEARKRGLIADAGQWLNPDEAITIEISA